MASVQDYQDLVAWQLADQLRREVYALLRDGPARRDFDFADQLRRSASGVAANIVEGFRRFGATEFARFLQIAYASAGETRSWLEDGVARGHWTHQDIAALLTTLKRLDPALLGLMRYLRTPEARNRSKQDR